MTQTTKKMNLTSLAVPIFVDMFLRTLTMMTNTTMISAVDVNLVAAIGTGGQVAMLFITIFSFLSIGCSVVVAQALGAKKRNLATRAIHIALTFNAFVGGVCALLLYSFTDFFLGLLNIPNDLLPLSATYLKVVSIALFLDSLGIVMAAIIRVKNHAFVILVISLLMNVVSITGNALALFEWFGLPFFGVSGVGVSTLVSRIFAVVGLYIALVKVAKVHIFAGLLVNFDMQILAKILKIGLPSAGENVTWMVQYMVAFSFVALCGAVSVGVQTIYLQLSMFIFLFGESVSMANEIIVGHLVGAGKKERAYFHAFRTLKIGLFVTLLVLAVFFVFREQIMSFLNLSEEHKALMRPLFYLSLALESGRTFNIVMVNSLRAAGDARFPFVVGVIFMIGVSLPVGWFFGLHLGWGILGVWLGFCVDEWGRAVCNTWRWRSKKWETKKLV